MIDLPEGEDDARELLAELAEQTAPELTELADLDLNGCNDWSFEP